MGARLTSVSEKRYSAETSGGRVSTSTEPIQKKFTRALDDLVATGDRRELR